MGLPRKNIKEVNENNKTIIWVQGNIRVGKGMWHQYLLIGLEPFCGLGYTYFKEILRRLETERANLLERTPGIRQVKELLGN